MSIFSERIKSLRVEHEYSMRYVAQKCGISKSSVHLYELGERKPKREVLEAFADLYNCDIDYLTGKSDIRNATANLIGYRSLAEAYEAGVDIDDALKNYIPPEASRHEEDEELIKLIRLMPPEMKAMYKEALRAALKSQGLI